MLTSHERRRKEPSYAMPFFFEILEITLIWIVFGIFEGTLDVMEWNIFSYGLSSVWFIFTIYKLNNVLDRQTQHKW